MPRGVLVNERTIRLANGTDVTTFIDCDEGYLEDKGVKAGDVVSFSYVSGSSKHAAEIEKVTPTAKERELQATVKSRKKAKPAKARTAKALSALLVEHGLIEGATPKQLSTAIANVDDPAADDAAFRLLIALPASTRPHFVLCDFHVDPSTVTEISRALGDKLALRIDRSAPASIGVTLLAGTKAVASHEYNDTLSFLDWVQGELVARKAPRRLYYLTCGEGYAVVVIAPKTCAALRAANVPTEDEPQIE
ncbi:MAG: hypothetical protein QM831_14620 [Kofleriaceae bacterium]